MEEKRQGQGIRSRLSRLDKRDRSLALKLGLCLLAGIALMSWAGVKGGGGGEADEAAAAQPRIAANGEQELEARLAALLAQVRGAGQVSVMLVYADQGATEHVLESQHETQTNEQSSSIRQSSGLALADGQPVEIKNHSPTVQGAVVVADGAGDAVVAERLSSAVRSLLGINADQIAIIERERSE